MVSQTDGQMASCREPAGQSTIDSTEAHPSTMGLHERPSSSLRLSSASAAKKGSPHL